MDVTQAQREQIIEFCKNFVNRHGSIRVGYAITQVVGDDYKAPTHLKEKIANTIIQSGEYLKEKAAKKYDDWNIYRNPDFNKVTKIDKINLGIGLTSILFAGISMFIAMWAIRSNETIAEKSGAFDKGDLKLAFGGYFIYPDIDFDVYYGVDFSDKKIKRVATLPISIHNVGQKTVENANVIIKYPHIANIAIADSLVDFSILSIEPIERRLTTVEPYDQVSFKLNSINPNYSIGTSDLIRLQKETIFHDVFPVTTKDSAILNLEATLHYALPIVVGVTAKDIISTTYNFSLNYRNFTEIDALIEHTIKEKIEKQKSKMKRSFFVIIPTQEQLIGAPNYPIAHLSSNSANTVLCQFDETMSSVIVLNQDGSIRRKLDVSDLK